MRRNIDGSCSGDPCCKPRNVRTINTMNPDDSGNFTIRGDQGIHVTVGTNEIIITGVAVYYDNLDGNLVIDNDAMTIDFAEDIVIAGDLTVNGTYYTVHAEHVYTEDDYIIMRNGAVTGLGSGQYSGFQVTKYDGTNDGRLVIDNSGTARVGDVGDEQPLLTREESANLNNGALLKWDASTSKAIDEGTVGSDTKPIKIVNGVATPVTNNLIDDINNQTINGIKSFYYPSVKSVAFPSGSDGYFQSTRIGAGSFLLIGQFNPAHSTDRVEIRMGLGDDGTVGLYLWKSVNGVESQITLATL